MWGVELIQLLATGPYVLGRLGWREEGADVPPAPSPPLDLTKTSL